MGGAWGSCQPGASVCACGRHRRCLLCRAGEGWAQVLVTSGLGCRERQPEHSPPRITRTLQPGAGVAEPGACACEEALPDMAVQGSARGG